MILLSKYLNGFNEERVTMTTLILLKIIIRKTFIFGQKSKWRNSSIPVELQILVSLALQGGATLPSRSQWPKVA